MTKILEKTEAIVIQSIRYGDSSLIVKMLTEEYGMQSYMVKGVYGSRSKFRPALFQNMTILDIVATQNKSSLAFIKEISLSHHYTNLFFDIKKSSILLFVSELLSKSITESETDKMLFNYIKKSMMWLDTAEANYANFPLVFAMGLCRYLGFFPNIDSYEEGFHFDILDGRFRKDQNIIYPVDKEISKCFYEMCMQDIDRMNLAIDNKKRLLLLDVVVSYFKLHFDNIKEIQSYGILHEILGV